MASAPTIPPTIERYAPKAMRDPTGETDIELEIMSQYGSGPSFYAPLEYPDGTEEWVLARGYDRLLAKVWKSKLPVWAAKTGVRTGTAYLGPILCGPHRGGEFRTLWDKPSRVYGAAASSRLIREDEAERLLSDAAEIGAFAEETEAFAQEEIADLDEALEQCTIAGDKPGQIAVQEDIAEIKASLAKTREAWAAVDAAIARLRKARARRLGARRLPG